MLQNSYFKYHFKETLKDRHMKRADLLKTTHVKFWAKEEVTMMLVPAALEFRHSLKLFFQAWTRTRRLHTVQMSIRHHL